MKAIVKVGDVCITVDGRDLTMRQIRQLLMDAAGVAATLTPDPPETQPIGFTAPVLERLPDELVPEPGYEDED